MKKAAIFHSSAGTLAMIQSLTRELMPDAVIVHFVEDSMINDVIKNNGVTTAINVRLAAYVQCANLAGCQIFMTACSSIGRSVEDCQFLSPIPVMRIDEAMAREAVEKYENFAVLATVGTTLRPTLEFIERMAAESGRGPVIRSKLMEEAFTAFLAGDYAKHDDIVAAGIKEVLEQDCQAIVLAQASMSRVLDKTGKLPVPVLTSPERGVLLLKNRLEAMEGGGK